MDPKPPKEKKLKPRMRGEEWQMVGGIKATVLHRLKNGFVAVINESGKIGVFHDNVFLERLK